MDLKLYAIAGEGDANQETVWLEVVSDCNVGDYVLADDTFGRNGAASNKVRHVYFFPSKSVKKGDYIRLNTGVGKNDEYDVKDDAGRYKYKVHRFCWNLKQAVWNDTGDCAHLLKAPATQRQQLKVPPKK